MSSFDNIFSDEVFVDFYYQYLKSKYDSKNGNERMESKEIAEGRSFNGLKNALIHCLNHILNINESESKKSYVKWILWHHEKINAELTRFLNIQYLKRYQSIVDEIQTKMKQILNSGPDSDNSSIKNHESTMKNSLKKAHQKFTNFAINEILQRIKAINNETTEEMNNAFFGVEENVIEPIPQKLPFLTNSWYLIQGITNYAIKFPFKFLFSTVKHVITSFSISSFLSLFLSIVFAFVNSFIFPTSFEAFSVFKFLTIFGGVLQLLFIEYYTFKSVIRIQKLKHERLSHCRIQMDAINDKSENNFNFIINEMFEVKK